MCRFLGVVTALCHAGIADDFQVGRLMELQVVPDVIPAPPIGALFVLFPKGRAVNFGDIIAPNDASRPPTILFITERNALYTLILIDPDAPSRQAPQFKEWRHWIVINIPGLDISRGQVLTPYEGPDPPEGTGLHRYVFLVYKQRSRIRPQEDDFQDEIRGYFSSVGFANKYILGDPIFTNFFQSQHT